MIRTVAFCSYNAYSFVLCWGSMALYELAVFDPSDLFLIQCGDRVCSIPFMTRLGITNSWGGWSITGGTITIRVFGVTKVWLERILCFLGCAFCSYLHWVYWDLKYFVDEVQENPLWICPRSLEYIFFCGLACFGFGAFHVTGLYGLAYGVRPYGLTGKYNL
uniref:Putative photosystem antenna protein-like protein n=1 Tax=Helianthus annuus TaxID=4232 RepID=A0A1Y3BX58_HELAN